jgi:hypothetical protein
MPTPDQPYPDRPFPLLAAYCPACGHKDTLIRGFQGKIACTFDDCPQPYALSSLLADPEIANHLVIITARWEGAHKAVQWVLQHPVVERIDPHHFGCVLGQELPNHREANPRLADGTYRLEVTPRGRKWHLTKIGIVYPESARVEIS